MSKCLECNGTGKLKTPYSICEKCKGKECCNCNYTGYVNGWWYNCPNCIYGFVKKDKDIENISLLFSDMWIEN